APQQFARMAGDQPAQRGVRLHQPHGGLALQSAQLLERDGGGIVQGVQKMTGLAGAQAWRKPLDLGQRDRAVFGFDRAKQGAQSRQFAVTRIGFGGEFEEFQKGLGIPRRRQAEQRQQIP
ncbi:hypothetical protein RZS08_59000, partial [Arthrospira platensis SPKY1]|nr:hypothetical protein [Arthrospira platensis SPKY1]